MPAEAQPNSVCRSAAPPVIGTLDWAAELSAMLNSEEWGRLVQAVAAETPGGGPCVSALLQRAAKGMQSACAQLRRQPPPQQAVAGAGEGAAAAGAGLGSAASVSGRGAAAAAALVEVVQSVTWEKLHSGSWHEVPLAWRDAHSAACILAAAAADTGLAALPVAPVPAQPASPQQQAAGSTSMKAQAVAEATAEPAAASAAAQSTRAAEALRHLDMAAMMGGPLLRPAVDPLTSALMRRWQRLQPPRPRTQHSQPPPPPSPPQQGATEGRGGGQAPRAAKRARAVIAALAGGELPEPGAVAAGPGVPRAPGSTTLPIWSLGPRGRVLPEEHLPSLESFWARYMSCGEPCVIAGGRPRLAVQAAGGWRLRPALPMLPADRAGVES